MAKYSPKTKLRLIELVEDSSVYLGDIDTSNITDMSKLFENSKRTDFSGIEKWDTSSVENMESMFASSVFNHNINDWNVSNVINMRHMFEFTPFNQPLDKWNVSSVEDMEDMFCGSKFNQNINDWNVSKVTYMGYMFGSTPFNQPLDKWNVSKVTNMRYMFNKTPFNQPLDKWNVSSVEDMESMFFNNSHFNQPLDKWDTSNVNNVLDMFSGATSFTQSIESWNVSNISDEYMDEMFNKLSPLQYKELKLPSWWVKRFSKPKSSTFESYDYFTISAIFQQLKLAYIVTYNDYGDFEKLIKKYPSKIAAMKEQRKSPNGIYNDCAMGYNPNEIGVYDLQFLIGMDKEKCKEMCQNARLAIVAKTKGDKISEILGVYDTILDALEAMPYKNEQCYLGYQPILKANEVVGKDFNIVKNAIKMIPIKLGYCGESYSSYWWVEVNDKGIITKIIKALENEDNKIKDEIMTYKDDLPKADDKCHFEFIEIIISKGRD